MASSSGTTTTTTTTSSGSSLLHNSGSEEDLQNLMDLRKRKRMISNRDSARRSRMRKQKHLDDLMAQLAQLRKENNQIITTMSLTTQNYLNIEADNSILRAQMVELTSRLQSLNEIITFMDVTATANASGLNNNANHFGTVVLEEEMGPTYGVFTEPVGADFFMFNNNMNMNHNSAMNMNHLYANQQAVMASADMFQY